MTPLLFAALTPRAYGQTLTTEYGVTYAGHNGALERPTGVGGAVDLPISDHLGARLRVTHHTESLVVRRSPCSGLPPPDADCTPERFDGDAQLTTYGAGVVARLPRLVSTLRPELYALALAANLEAAFRGRRSGTQIRPVEGLSVGLEVGATLTYTVIPHLTLMDRVGTQFVHFGTCGADAWFPFCNSRPMPQGSLGLRVHLSVLGP
ncbi:MAG: hypothetical protein V5A22_13680 [Salinivenus sp.]